MTWTEKPDKDGYWWFKGYRKSRSKGYMVLIDGPVQVKIDRKYPEPTIFYPGSGAVYVISQHEGFWCFLEDMFKDIQVG